MATVLVTEPAKARSWGLSYRKSDVASMAMLATSPFLAADADPPKNLPPSLLNRMKVAGESEVSSLQKSSTLKNSIMNDALRNVKEPHHSDSFYPSLNNCLLLGIMGARTVQDAKEVRCSPLTKCRNLTHEEHLKGNPSEQLCASLSVAHVIF